MAKVLTPAALGCGMLFIIAAVAGWALGMAAGTPGPEGGAGWSGEASPAKGDASKAKWSRDDVLGFARGRMEKIHAPGFNPYEEVVADWTDEEIRAALDESLKHPECVLPGASASEIPSFLLGVWMKRDLDAALAWVEGMGSSSLSRRMRHSLAFQWPLERAVEGVDYLVGHRESFPGNSASLLLNKAIQSKISEGAEAVKAVLRKIEGAGLEIASVGDDLKVPDGFDFRSLMDSPELEKIWDQGPGKDFALEWFAQDRDAAFDWMQGKHGLEDVYLLAYRTGGDLRGDMRWLGGKIGTMDPEQREVFFGSVETAWKHSPSFAALFVEGLEDPDLKDEARLRFGTLAMTGQSVPQALELLEGVRDVSRRIAAVKAGVADGVGKGGTSFFSAAQDAELLRRKLAEWEANPEEIESIINGNRE